ncbi:hypothetical protein DFH29DRAFT_895911, partial [Suillus ampliporus]
MFLQAPLHRGLSLKMMAVAPCHMVLVMLGALGLVDAPPCSPCFAVKAIPERMGWSIDAHPAKQGQELTSVT